MPPAELSSHTLLPFALVEPHRYKESRLERVILFGEGSLRKATHEFSQHYHHERNHQGLGNRLIMREESCAGSTGEIQRRQRLGGMLNYYYRRAA
jgi:hypothetical protein